MPMRDALQFYPTGRQLAERAFGTFKNRSFTRVLEPSAGRGDLLAPLQDWRSWSRPPADVVELNLDNVAVLREKGYRVVGHDFLNFRGSGMYSHIIMNPPFAQGAEHMLHAWEILFTGEIVGILNAETIRNPYTAKRQQLVRLIEQYGTVEYLSDAFMDPDTLRKTEVEVALVYLRKESDINLSFIDGLKVDRNAGLDVTVEDTDLAVPGQKIRNMVIDFNLAVEAARESVIASIRANNYAARLGMALNASEDDLRDDRAARNKLMSSMTERYDDLKARAWSAVLQSTEFMSKLSTKARKAAEAQFENIKQLEFTVENIYGFLTGIVAQQGEIQNDMVCEVFDLISRYHESNVYHYQGWKSNSRHRQFAYRLLTTRFILPSSNYSWYDGLTSSASRNDTEWMNDLDKVFAMLDGKTLESVARVADVFNDHYAEFKAGKRLSSDYFDLRFYPGKRTFHLFPRRKDLVERLNRIVGKIRKWLPDSDHIVTPEFWEQYGAGEKVQSHMKGAVDGREVWKIQHGSELERARALEKLYAAQDKALQAVGIEYDPDRAIAAPAELKALPLSKAS